MLGTRIGRLRVVSLVEGVSYLLLLLISRWALDWHAGVAVLGPIHGILFVAYVLGVLDLHRRMRWDNPTLIKLLVASAIPFATFVVERWLRSQHEPVGSGRAESRQAG